MRVANINYWLLCNLHTMIHLTFFKLFVNISRIAQAWWSLQNTIDAIAITLYTSCQHRQLIRPLYLACICTISAGSVIIITYVCQGLGYEKHWVSKLCKMRNFCRMELRNIVQFKRLTQGRIWILLSTGKPAYVPFGAEEDDSKLEQKNWEKSQTHRFGQTKHCHSCKGC